jgi:hypothetical protein
MVFEKEGAMARWTEFTKCPGCGLDFATGEGERGCAWGDCPYLPRALDVFCDYCRFNFLTMEGNAPCPDPLTCDHAAEPLSHVENMKRWAEKQAVAQRSTP